MALVASLPCVLESCSPETMREPSLLSVSESVKTISFTRVDLWFRGSLGLCHCGRRSAISSSGRTAERGVSDAILRGENSGGPALIPDSGSVRSWNATTLGPSRAIKILREPALDKDGQEDEDEDDNDLCPVECVREFKSQSEFDEILLLAKQQNSLVVVDFFKTACGSCRYIEKGFIKLCKGAGNKDVSVIFLKHNVVDEYEEQSEVAERFKIRVVPLFHFYKDGELVDSFPTREKSKILEAICKHTGLQLEDLPIPSGV